MILSSILLLFAFAGVVLASESDYLKLKPEMFGGYFYKLISDRTVKEYLFGTNGYVTAIFGDQEAVTSRWFYWKIEGDKTLLMFQKTNSTVSHVFKSMTETNAVTVKGLRFTRKRATVFEGTYSGSGDIITLKDGKFTMDGWTDVGPTFEYKTTGTYVVEGNRVTLSGTRSPDKKEVTSVWYAYVVDSVPLLVPLHGNRLLPFFACMWDVLPKGMRWPELFRQRPNIANLSSYLGHSWTTPEEFHEMRRERNLP